MRKQFIYRFLAIFMAIYLPVALIGVPLHKHYCEGKLASVKVLVEAETCHDLDFAQQDHGCCSTEMSCHTETQDSDCDTNDCCEDEMELIKVDLTVILQKANDYKQDLAEIVFTAKADNHIILFQLHPDSPQAKNLQSNSPYPDRYARLVHQGKFLC